AIDVVNKHKVISQVAVEQRRSHRRAVSGDQPPRLLRAEDHTPNSVDGDQPRRQATIANVLGTSTQGAARAGGAEHIINPSIKRADYLVHRLVVSGRIIEV